MEFLESSKVVELIKSYPEEATRKMFELRNLILVTAEETGIKKLMETTKWGEPSYICNEGSTIRMDWKERSPGQVFLYFICTTDLVNTFKFIFGDELAFEGNRAICLAISEPLPEKAIKKCIALALTYKKVKHLPHLGE